MKISHLSIIFIIIMLPLAVVLSTYMQLQADVVLAKEDLSTKLLDATYDGIVSFELNTLKIDNLPGTSIKEHVSGAVNTFFDTMAMNMGSSGGTKLDVRGYVPAILFTSYDGYYIYSPVKTVTPQINFGPTPGAPGYGVATEQGESTEADKKDDTKEVLLDPKTGSAGIPLIDNNDKYNDNNKKLSYNYMVKPFIYYSANYSNANYNVTVNYSLDNHIALYAKYKSADDSSIRYATKSGYLINYKHSADNRNVEVKINGSSKFYIRGTLDEEGVPGTVEPNVDKAITYNSLTESQWVTLIEDKDANLQDNTVVRTLANKTDLLDDGYAEGYFHSGGYKYLIRGKHVTTKDATNMYIGMSKNGISDIGGESIIDYTLKKDPDGVKLTVNGEEIKDVDAKEYYLKAFFFSKWVHKEFGKNKKSDVKINTIKNVYKNDPKADELWDQTAIRIENQGIDELKMDASLFDIENENPEDEKSIFNQHRRQVIQNSIQYNLNSAISTYSALYKGNTDFTMPVLSPTDWDNILNKVSIVTFMQGVPIGGSVWGDYAVATSTNNKLFVNKNNLLFIEESKLSKVDDITEVEDYHRIDCFELAEASLTDELVGAMSYEYTYDADKVNAKVYISGGKKYYEHLGVWYDYNGVKMSAAPPSPTKLASAYVRFSNAGEKSYSIKVLFVDDESVPHYYPTECYQYSKVESDGRLIKINGSAKNDVHLQDTNTKKFVYDLKKHAEQELYLYDHANVPCYWCMMGANYNQINFFGDFMGSTDKTAYFFRGKKQGNISTDQLKKLNKAWLTYLGKYRCKQYKTTDAIQR